MRYATIGVAAALLLVAVQFAAGSASAEIGSWTDSNVGAKGIAVGEPNPSAPRPDGRRPKGKKRAPYCRLGFPGCKPGRR